MDISYQLTITERLASEFRRKSLREVFEFLELFANINVGLRVLIQKTGQQSLRATRILDRLRRKEQVLGSRIVIGSIVGLPRLIPLFASRVFEEKNHAIYRSELIEECRIESD
jgi:hypothetical protein